MPVSSAMKSWSLPSGTMLICFASGRTRVRGFGMHLTQHGCERCVALRSGAASLVEITPELFETAPNALEIIPDPPEPSAEDSPDLLGRPRAAEPRSTRRAPCSRRRPR